MVGRAPFPKEPGSEPRAPTRGARRVGRCRRSRSPQEGLAKHLAAKQLVGLLVAEVTVGKKPEDGRTEVRITYRFGPPPTSGSAGSPSHGGVFVSGLKKGSRS